MTDVDIAGAVSALQDADREIRDLREDLDVRAAVVNRQAKELAESRAEAGRLRRELEEARARLTVIRRCLFEDIPPARGAGL